MSVSRQLSAISICNRESEVRITVREVRYPSATDAAVACLGTGAFGVPGSAPHRAQAHIAPLPASTAPRLSLPHPRYPYRFTCSRDECGVIAGSLRRGGLSYISAVSFLFAFSVFGGREPRSIFPLAKVGLTVQRKIYLTDFFINFYQSPPCR